MGDAALLTGWGRTTPSRATVVAPSDASEVRSLLLGADARGILPRGLGRSYGDAAQCAGGTVLDMRQLSGIGEIQPLTGMVEVGAGASLDALVRRTLPRGWFPRVTPGTRQVTVGGAVAADVHGKNHHRDGSFCRHVASLTLETPTGSHEVGPEQDSELFWATAGAMGLTGVVTRVTLSMLPVETDRVVVDTDRFSDLDGVMAEMEARDAGYRYSVAWVDCTATGRRTGRAVLTRGDHAKRADLPPHARRPPAVPRGPLLRAPRGLPAAFVNPVAIRAFNDAWYRRAPRHRVGELQPITRFFHPLDGMSDWNLLYGPRGFVQYQFAVGPESGDAVRKAVDILSSNRLPSFLAVLKRFGPASPGPLSFPMTGWTLALDLPVGPSALPDCLDRLDELVAEAGGRIYLAKDARLRPDLVSVMYPRLDQLAAVRQRVDPKGVLRSDLSRRLAID